jgi:hypothetical protein
MFAHLLLFIISAGLASVLWHHWHVLAQVRALEPIREWFFCSSALLALWQTSCAWRAWREARRKSKPLLRLGGFAWNMNDFCRGWLITGETGSGKTLAAINTMLWQVSKNCPRRGGICIDDKGLYWETLSGMFHALGREKDLILLKVRPADAPTVWEPSHMFNFWRVNVCPIPRGQRMCATWRHHSGIRMPQRYGCDGQPQYAQHSLAL